MYTSCIFETKDTSWERRKVTLKQNNLFGDEYISFLQSTITSAKPVAGGREVLCRCFYCPDSTDPTHGHMYISVPQNADEPSEFHCKKCGAAGYVTTNRLIEWGIYDPAIGMKLDAGYKKSMTKIKTSGNRLVYNLVNGVINKDLASEKVSYINDRLGTAFSMQDLINMNVVLNLEDLLKINNINDMTRHPTIISQLNKYFVGFLSADRNFVNLRRMCPEGVVYKSIDMRYVNYNIFNKRDNTEKMYIVSANINPLLPMEIHLAEGPFDILQIYNIRSFDHGLYCAIGGSGYAHVMNFLIDTLKLYGYINIHIYPDNDSIGTQDKMMRIAKFYQPYGFKFFIHRNIYPGEKDMGCHISRINESITEINMW